MTPPTQQGAAWPLPSSLDDEVMTRTHEQLDVTVELTESEIGAWTSSTQERVSRSLKTAVRAIRAMAPKADRSGSPCWLVHMLAADQRDAALELLLVAADDAAVQLAIATATENARRHAESVAFNDTQAELVDRIGEQLATAHAQGAAEARRVLEETPPASTTVPQVHGAAALAKRRSPCSVTDVADSRPRRRRSGAPAS